MKLLLTASALFVLVLNSCKAPQAQPTPIPTQPSPASAPLTGSSSTLTPDEEATLASLELVDQHPLYTMRYVGSYAGRARLEPTTDQVRALEGPPAEICDANWGCSLFATLGDENNRLYGRNFDWQFSPAVLLFTSPPDGYASVSVVDIEYLGFEGDRASHIEDLSLEARRPLLAAPLLPFDGMNEKGIAVGMAAVPAEEMPHDPQKRTIGELRMIREILDHAGSVQEAVDIFGTYNVDMGDVPIHYLIASASGESALVEFRRGEMVVFRNEARWQHATNFLLASSDGHPQGECWRYDRISDRLMETGGELSGPDALHLLEEVSQENTQWSLVYNMTTGDLRVVMDRRYSGDILAFHLARSAE